jgi:hypothetical protein
MNAGSAASALFKGTIPRTSDAALEKGGAIASGIDVDALGRSRTGKHVDVHNIIETTAQHLDAVP